MSIQKYKAYLRTVETGSITQTANELGYTQSAVSKMIADLESEWNVRLLNRSRSGIEPTSEGIALLPAIRTVVEDCGNLSFAVSELHGIQSGLLRIGCFISLSAGVLPELLKGFRHKHPNIRVQVVNGEYEELTRRLRRGAVDCAFLTIPASPEFETTFLLRDSFVAILPEGHPLADEPVFAVENLAKVDFVKFNGPPDRDADRFLDSLLIRPRVAYEASNDFALLAMVESGLGVSIVHDLILHPRRYRLVRRPLDIKRCRDIGLTVRRNTPLSSVTKLFLDHVRSCAERLTDFTEFQAEL